MRALPYEDPGQPDLRSPLRLMLWTARLQWKTLVSGATFGVIWMVTQALVPAAIGRAIDEGITGKDNGALLTWAMVITGLGLITAVSGVLRHRFSVANWLFASLRMAQLLGQHTARYGRALQATIPTGDIVATLGNDAMRFGGSYDVTARLAGAVVSYVVVAVILLNNSLTLGLLVLIGVPILILTLLPLLGPLHATQREQREAVGRLTALGADTVAGLRVIRGIGGEEGFSARYKRRSQEVRQAGVRVAGIQALLDAAQVLLPGAFTVSVVWLGARFAVEGQITAGQLVAFYGYAYFLVVPLRTATEAAERFTRSFVAGTKIIRLLSVRPSLAGSDVVDAEPPSGADLVDERSGVVVHPGELLALVSPDPEDTAAIADRLGRFVDDGMVTLGGVPLARLPLPVVRRRIMVSETEPRVFSGILRNEIDPWHKADDEQIMAAVTAASAEDVLDALPDGLQGTVTERGRSFSGGQRQRAVLARALIADPEILIMLEPTSAVDAHTEARIAERLKASRAGRATVITTTSPLLLDRADRVCFIVDGIVVADGKHRELMHASPRYHDTVIRGEDS